MRGIAALAVTIFHIFGPLGITTAFAHGPLAVDFFFVLSGFVIAYAYEDKLISHMTIRRFLWVRFVRLYPMLLIGTALGVTVSAAKLIMTGELDVAGLLIAASWAILILPFGTMVASPLAAFPFNLPVWSLFYEIVSNIVYAVFVRWMSITALATIIGLAFAVLGWHAVVNDTLDFGRDLNEFLPALARVGFSFFLGVLLSRLRGPLKAGSGIPLVVLLLVVLASPITPLNGLFELVAVGIVFPSIVYAAAGTQPRPALSAAYAYLGRLSYPLYLLHYPIMRMFLFVQERYELKGWVLYASIVVELATMIAASVLVLKLFDEPVRAWLRGLRWRTRGRQQEAEPT